MVRHYYKALFDYDGTTGDRMIPITAGEILFSDEDQSNTDWYAVTRVSDNTSGLVPAKYVKEISSDEAMAGSMSRAPAIPDLPAGMNRDTVNSNSGLGVADLTSSGKVRAGMDAAPNDAVRSGMPGSLSAGASLNQGLGGSGTDGLPDSFAEMFSRHDAYFRQVVKQREESFKRLESALAAASKDIAACKEKNAKLTQRITELDALIEEERRNWRERLEREKKNLLQNTQ